MRVTLINTADLAPSERRVPLVCPPLGLAYLAATLREQGHAVAIVDGVGEAIGRFTPFLQGTFLHGLPIEELVERVPADSQVLGVGVMFSDYWPLAKRVVAALRRRFPKVPIVLGGEHVTACPRFCLEDSVADYAVLGEGEETLADLVRRLGDGVVLDAQALSGLVYRGADGGIVENPRRNRMRALDRLPWPAWDLVPIERYMDAGLMYGVSLGARSMVVLASRGCPYTCKFCSNESMWGIQYFRRDPKDVVDEIEHYIERYGARDFHFHDLTFVVNRKWSIEVAREIARRGLNITWQLVAGTRSEAIDEEVLRAFSESGCRAIYLAPESGSQRIIDVTRKRVDLEKVLGVARLVRRERIDMRVGAFIIYGFPEETWRDVLLTYKLLLRMLWAGFDVVDAARFSAYPGSEYHDVAVREGRIRYDDDYFLSLQRKPGRFGGASWHPRWSGAVIVGLQLVHYALYLSGYFLVQPRRILGFLSGVLRNRPQSRFERFFAFALWQPLRRATSR